MLATASLLIASFVVLASSLPKCNHVTAFQGKWIAVPNSKHQRHFCYEATADMAILRQDRYLCNEYRPAKFKPSSCSLNSIADSLNTIRRHIDAVIAFVGDSLAGQQFVAASCLLEERQIDHVKLHHISDFFLDHVIRCTNACLYNATYRSQFSGEYFNPCYSCPNGEIKENPLTPPKWISAIPNSTNVLILNSGAWYNAAQGLDDSNHAYFLMLRRIAPLLQSFVQNGMIVLWISLPPAYISNSTKEGYHWHYFARKNDIVSSVLRDAGVVILDPTPATLARKLQDYHVSHDAVHWWYAKFQY